MSRRFLSKGVTCSDGNIEEKWLSLWDWPVDWLGTGRDSGRAVRTPLRAVACVELGTQSRDGRQWMESRSKEADSKRPSEGESSIQADLWVEGAPSL